MRRILRSAALLPSVLGGAGALTGPCEVRNRPDVGTVNSEIEMTTKLMLAIVAAMTLSACNTMAGAGKDVSAAGTAVTNTADKTESKM